MNKLQFGITVCWSMLCFVIVGLENQQLEIVPSGTPVEKAKTVVKEANRVEHEWYKDPTNEDRAKMFATLVTGPRYDEVVGRISRAKSRGDKAKDAWCRIDEFVNVTINTSNHSDGKKNPIGAVVKTIETGRLEWTILPPPRGVWEQNRKPHTYYLVPDGMSWKIERDEFEK